MAGIQDLSTSEASNSQTGGWNTAENQDPSTVNDGLRRGKEILAAFYDDLGGVNTVGGTADVLTVALASVAGTSSISAYATGHMFTFKSASANTTSVSVNVNGIGAKHIRKIAGGTDAALVQGDILAAVPYSVVYDAAANSAAGAYIIKNPSNLAVGGRIAFPATQNASSDANTLDDYEEGSTTPTPTTTGGAFTSASSLIIHTKIGRQVSIKGTVGIVTNGGSASGAVQVTLPFTNANDNPAPAWGVRTDSLVGLTGYVGANSSTLNFTYYNGTYPGSDGVQLQFGLVYTV